MIPPITPPINSFSALNFSLRTQTTRPCQPVVKPPQSPVPCDAIGFTIAEVDSLIAGLAPAEDGDPTDDYLPKVTKGPPRTKPGDLWALGFGRPQAHLRRFP